jgi:alkylation response protein AidB-like acyl-CoA dehydrogenase
VDFDVTDEQRMLRESISDFISREAPPSRLTRVYRDENGYDAELYRAAAELGWLGMLVPEKYGGSDLRLADCAAAFEAFGSGPLPGPLFTSGVLAAIILLEGGSPEQQEHYLPEIASGETKAAVAALDSGLGWGRGLVESRLSRQGNGFVLDGHKRFVHDAMPADVVICAARAGDDTSDGLTLVLIERSAPGVSIHGRPGVLTAVSEVRLDGVAIPREAVIGEIGRGWELLERSVERSLPLLCAFKVGACQTVLDFTLQYTRDRFAFGQAIGRFQRVQDHIVDLANHTDAARLITNELVGALERGDAAPWAVHEAKAVASEAYYQACNFSHMVHAGPGTDLDHPLMAHTLLSRSLYQHLGDPEHHKRRMMDRRYPLA